jgi:hypothetical protein
MASTRLRSVKCKVANIVLPFLFKFSRNPNNESPLMIPPKFLAIPFYEASSKNSKVTSNFKSKLSNLIVWLVCLGGLSTFIPSTAPNLFEIQVLANEKDEPLS